MKTQILNFLTKSENRIIVYLVFVVVSLVLTCVLTPPEVKVLKTERVRVVVDTHEISRLRQENISLKRKIDSLLVDKEVVEIVKEIRYPDGRVEVLTERRSIDKSRTLLVEVEVSSQTQSSTSLLTQTVSLESVKEKVKTPLSRKKLLLLGFSSEQDCELGLGLSLSNNISVGASLIYNLNRQKSSLGGRFLLRW